MAVRFVAMPESLSYPRLIVDFFLSIDENKIRELIVMMSFRDKSRNKLRSDVCMYARMCVCDRSRVKDYKTIHAGMCA